MHPPKLNLKSIDSIIKRSFLIFFMIIFNLSILSISKPASAATTPELDAADIAFAYLRCLDFANIYTAPYNGTNNTILVDKFNAGIYYVSGGGGEFDEIRPIGFGIDSNPATDDGGRYCKNMESTVFENVKPKNSEGVVMTDLKSYLKLPCVGAKSPEYSCTGADSISNVPDLGLDTSGGLKNQVEAFIRANPVTQAHKNWRYYKLFQQCYQDMGAVSEKAAESGWFEYNDRYYTKYSDNINRLAKIWYPLEDVADGSEDKAFPVGFSSQIDDAKMQCKTVKNVVLTQDLANQPGVKDDPSTAPPSGATGGGTGTGASGATGGGTATDDDPCLAKGTAFLSWMICPAINIIDDVLKVFTGFIKEQLHFDPEDSAQIDPEHKKSMKAAWGVLRGIASLIIIIGFLVALLVKSIRGE
jgi:hypothetical protein